MRVRRVMGALGVAAIVSIGAMGARADEWFVLSERVLKPADPSVEITSEGSRWDKNVKQVKFTVEGADVQITQAALNWDNAKDEMVWNVGTLKPGGETAPKDAPGRKGRLKAVKVQYKILGDAPSATLKVWGYD